MDFDEAMRRYAELYAQWEAGCLRLEDFHAAVAELRVQDEAGVWWQIDPATGGWLTWDGTAWVPSPSEAEISPPAGGSPTLAQAGAGAGAGGVSVQAGQLAASQRSQAGGRSQRWWDLLSIFGGGAAGVVWFFYSNVRAASEGRDYLTPALMVALPIVLVTLRRPIDGLLSPLQGVRQRIPRLFLIGAGIVAPYVVSQLLYGMQVDVRIVQLLGGTGGDRLIEYPFLHASLVVGTIVSYLILRTPQLSQRSPGIQ